MRTIGIPIMLLAVLCIAGCSSSKAAQEPENIDLQDPLIWCMGAT